MASDQHIYLDIAKRTGGDIYIGVVGPVRTGKSTFIRKFMENAVLPNIENEYDKRRATDETPQSAGGRTVTTTEPKFVPDEAVTLSPDGKTVMRVRLVDCVGYLVPGALGLTEENAPRMVHTPWSEDAIPFGEAAEIGTRQVIREHSTIGILVTTDGSIGDIPREDYVKAEEKAAQELTAAKKPYAIILNSANPESENAVALAYSLEKKYGAPVALVNCLMLDAGDIAEIFGMVLREFPVTQIRFTLPSWLGTLPKGHWLRSAVTAAISEFSDRTGKMGELQNALMMSENGTCGEYIDKWESVRTEVDTGRATVKILPKPELYYKILSELSGIPVDSDAAIVSLLSELSETKRSYDKIQSALTEAEEKGYGIVMPRPEDMTLSTPEVVHTAGGYGVKLHASARSLHLIRADIETEFSPTVGSEAASEDMIRSILEDYDADKNAIWHSELFGRPLFDIVSDGIRKKLENLPDNARTRLGETVGRIVNEGSGGLICILL